jgi:hypothetical protein
VRQVSPACRAVGRFVVHARKGVNRVRFTGRVGRRNLGPGTYFLEARTPSGGLVQRVTVVVVNGAAPTRSELEALRTANVCATTSTFGSTSPFLTSPLFTGGVRHRQARHLGKPESVTHAQHRVIRARRGQLEHRTDSRVGGREDCTCDSTGARRAARDRDPAARARVASAGSDSRSASQLRARTSPDRARRPRRGGPRRRRDLVPDRLTAARFRRPPPAIRAAPSRRPRERRRRRAR